MKNLNYIINGVLAVAVIILFIMQFSGKKESTVTRTFVNSDGSSTEASLPVAYVNVDSLLLNYNYAKDLYEVQLKKQENARANIGQQIRELEKDFNDFQRKLENNGFLSRERAEQEQQRLLRKQQELQELDNRMANELMLEEQKLNLQLRDSVVNQLGQFNSERGYEIILSNTGGDNILYASKMYDITEDFIQFLNKNYSGQQ